MSDWNDDERIGYKNPPKYTRFQKGHSGNPKGRPRKIREKYALPLEGSATDDALRQELDRKIAVKDANGKTSLTGRQLVARAQLKSAANGNPIAQRDILKQARELELRDAERTYQRAQIEAQQQAQDEQQARRGYESMVKFKQVRAQLWAQAQTEGKAEPDYPWPHPDDILLIDPYSYKWRIRGPMFSEDIPYAEYCRAERDTHFVQSILYRRSSKRRGKLLGEIFSYIWVFFDLQLPKRWQVLEDCRHHLWDYAFLPMRTLRAKHESFQATANRWRIIAIDEKKYRKEVYKITNDMMKPLLAPYGYRSLAEFERAYEETNGNPPWPKPEALGQ
ncbi:DUF5681 domain-containing protein [Caenibius sp. WL]|uniref:DUF5681 domain-containing protein n=1 Tax=Caenibius sp. WL TaxID=2872646 RepID=UPI001C9994EC|nr:DUF5681 domain-containing protein [Caenibius sp. WL]QZP09153.1 DUF5681 domain-containing protein [Caenibius sp. WL]